MAAQIESNHMINRLCRLEAENRLMRRGFETRFAEK